MDPKEAAERAAKRKRNPPRPDQSKGGVTMEERAKRLDQVEDWLIVQGWRTATIVEVGCDRWKCVAGTIRSYITDVRDRVNTRYNQSREERVAVITAKREGWVRTLTSERTVVVESRGKMKEVIVQPGPKELKVAHEIQSYIDALHGDRPDTTIRLKRALTAEDIAAMSDEDLNEALAKAGKILGP